jgi:hypothetical protein
MKDLPLNWFVFVVLPNSYLRVLMNLEKKKALSHVYAVDLDEGLLWAYPHLHL